MLIQYNQVDHFEVKNLVPISQWAITYGHPV